MRSGFGAGRRPCPSPAIPMVPDGVSRRARADIARRVCSDTRRRSDAHHPPVLVWRPPEDPGWSCCSRRWPSPSCSATRWPRHARPPRQTWHAASPRPLPWQPQTRTRRRVRPAGSPATWWARPTRLRSPRRCARLSRRTRRCHASLRTGQAHRGHANRLEHAYRAEEASRAAGLGPPDRPDEVRRRRIAR